MIFQEIRTSESAQFYIMSVLHNNPDLTQRELAKILGMSVGRLNYCLKALIEKGYVKVDNFHKSKNKFKYVYLLTPQGITEKVALTSRFLKLKMKEYNNLQIEIEALKAEIAKGLSVGKRSQN